MFVLVQECQGSALSFSNKKTIYFSDLTVLAEDIHWCHSEHNVIYIYSVYYHIERNYEDFS